MQWPLYTLLTVGLRRSPGLRRRFGAARHALARRPALAWHPRAGQSNASSPKGSPAGSDLPAFWNRGARCAGHWPAWRVGHGIRVAEAGPTAARAVMPCHALPRAPVRRPARQPQRPLGPAVCGPCNPPATRSEAWLPAVGGCAAGPLRGRSHPQRARAVRGMAWHRVSGAPRPRPKAEGRT